MSTTTQLRSKSNSPAAIHQAVMETLEQRQLFAGFAPTSIAASNITAAITSGAAPLNAAGGYTIQPTAVGTYAFVNPTGGVSAGAGTYNYFKTGDNVGDFQYTNSLGASYNDILTFTDAADGTYSITALGGGTGVQTGTFTYTAPVAQAMPDLTAAILQSPAGNAVAGDKGSATINIFNAGGAIAAGDVTVRLFVSPTGGPNDRTPVTPVTGNPVTRFVHLKPGSGTNVQFQFKYPAVATGDYFFVATATASPPLVDGDTSNNAALSTQQIQIAAPIVDLEAKSLAITGVSAGGAISGSRAHALLILKNVGNQLLAGGPVTITLSAADNADGIGETSLLPKPIQRMIHMPVNGMLNVPMMFTIPNVDVSTGEFFFATASTSGGTIVETDGVDANNTTGTANPLTVDPAVVTLRDVITTIPPTSVVGGKPGHATVRIFNDGNVLFHGAAPITLDVSPDTSLDDGTTLIFRSPVLAIPAKGFRDVPLNFKYPTTVANANYNLVAQTAATNTPVKGAIPPENIAVPASNVAVSSSPVNITQPFVTLSANFSTPPGTAFTVGQVTTLQASITNTGNVPSGGSYTVQLLASPTGSPSDPNAVPLTAVLTKPLGLGINRTVKLNFRITIPGTLTAGVDYSFVLNFDATNIKKITDTSFTAVSPMTFVVSS